jgi:hypothetical protein
MARVAIVGILALVAMLGGMAGAGAQLPPLDTGPIEDTVDQIEDTVDQVGGAVDQTVDDTVDQVGGAVDQTVDDTVETIEDTEDGTGATVGDAVSALTGGAGVGSATGTTLGGASAAGTGAGGSSPGGQHGGGRPGTGRSPTHRLGADGGEGRMARLLSETGHHSLVPVVYVPLVVQLTNDADGDGSYAEAESAPRPGADVPFQVRLENAGTRELAILAVRDGSPGPLGLPGEAMCGGVVGTRLAPNQSTVCRFTVEGLAPAEGERVVAVLEVDAAFTADQSPTGTVTDTSVIRTGDVGVLGAFVRGVLDTLATTGAWIGLLGAVAVGLAAAGAWASRLGNRQRDAGWTRIPSRSAAGVTATGTRRGAEPRPSRRRARSRTVGSSLAGHSTVRRDGIPAGRR